MALLSKTICWNIGPELTVNFTVKEGNIDENAPSSAIYNNGDTHIDFSPLYGGINAVGGFHINGKYLNPDSGKFTSLSMDGDVDPNTGESGNGAYSIQYPDGTIVMNPPKNPGQPPQWLPVSACVTQS